MCFKTTQQRRRLAAFFPLLGSILLALAHLGCDDSISEEHPSSEHPQGTSLKADGIPRVTARAGAYVDKDFGEQTALGLQILEKARWWEERQIDEADEYAQPRMCAHNVSKVLELSGLKTYSDYLIPNMHRAVSVRGGRVAQLDNRDKYGFIRTLNRKFGGRLPVGALISGCLYRDCGGRGGDGHIAIIGHTDDAGIVYLYHNNWYRPGNEEGIRKPHMVSERYHDEYNLRRQWMATPWIRVHRDVATDEIVDVEGLLPALDDLDPYSGFFLTVLIPPELLLELGERPGVGLFCPEGTEADPMLGTCVTGDAPEDDVYGLFSDEMVRHCVELGFGLACEARHRVEGDRYEIALQRWSRAAYLRLRGEETCPQGLRLDHEIGYCIQPASGEEGSIDEVFGPFPTELVDRCFRWGGGDACAGGRWARSFLKELQKRWW